MTVGNGLKQAGWYYRLSGFFREKFGSPVYKIPLDAGFSCPNRDGTTGESGCSFCYNPSFSPCSKDRDSSSGPLAVSEQVKKGLQHKPGAKHLAYFQAYTNTYSSPERLKSLYDEALEFPSVVGLSIATRPDCISEEVLKILEKYTQRYHVWIEYGLQSAHDRTLEKINRGHGAAAFEEAMRQTRGRGIYTCAHIILGLPGENSDMMLKTIDFLNRTKVDGVKFHHLQVIKGTGMEKQYRQGQIKLFKREIDYYPVLCDCIEQLSPAIVIHRLAGQVTSDGLLIAPQWEKSPGRISSEIETMLKERGTYQGYRA